MNEFVLIANDSASFRSRYGFVLEGQYAGNLSNGGEDIFLIYQGDTLIDLSYNDNVPWPILGDGFGFSIVPTVNNPTNNQKKASYWTNSVNLHGSPGQDEPTAPTFPDVWVNEVLSHTDLPNVDAVELFNNESVEIDISYWFLTDDRSKPYQYQFPEGSTIPAKGYLAINETDFNKDGLGFRFNRSGDNCYLVAANEDSVFSGFVIGEVFDGQYKGTSFGIYINHEGQHHFVAQSSPSFGVENELPKVGQKMYLTAIDAALLGGLLSIYNTNGQLVHQKEIIESSYFVSLIELNKGMYFCTYQQDGILLNRKIVLMGNEK